jgi:hypothetical protein
MFVNEDDDKNNDLHFRLNKKPLPAHPSNNAFGEDAGGTDQNTTQDESGNEKEYPELDDLLNTPETDAS